MVRVGFGGVRAISFQFVESAFVMGLVSGRGACSGFFLLWVSAIFLQWGQGSAPENVESRASVRPRSGRRSVSMVAQA